MSKTFGKDQLLTRKQAANYLGVKPGTLACWKCTGAYYIAVVKIGRFVRYRVSDLEKFIDSGRVN